MNCKAHRIVAALFVLALPLQLFAQDTQPTATVDPFLWEVTGPGGVTHLFGTIHVGVGVEELPSVVETRFEAAQQLILEADTRDVDPLEMLSMALLPEGALLADHIDEVVWTQLTQMLSQLGIPESQLAQMRPWMLEMLLVATIIPETDPMDMVFLGQAVDRGIELSFLEVWRDQIEMLNGLPMELTISDLLEWVNDGDTTREELFALLDGYRVGDIEAVELMMFDPEEVAERPEFYEQMIYQRNENWMPAIRTAIEQGNVFIAVGLGHLVGSRGLVEQLRGEGYDVRRVSRGQ